MLKLFKKPEVTMLVCNMKGTTQCTAVCQMSRALLKGPCQSLLRPCALQGIIVSTTKHVYSWYSFVL